ncbi:(ABC) transporter [Coemansia biformis]|uniref:(ABC) transporter n=1 Tax=Coemansia biformis TaxID=1286918 RepID=A0A9W7YIA9_9FUNG|nr:(ABC) transporter [Coemansia biformis]
MPASQMAGPGTNATFVTEAGAGSASRESGRLLLSLVKSANSTGYVGTTVYFTRWIHYGVVSAMIRSGSTAPGVISSFQLQSADGSSIDMDWVGASSNRVQANFYTRNQLDLAQAAAPVLAASPASSFIEYKIAWLPDSLTWYANGLAVRTVRRQDTWAEGEQRFNFPSSPARLSFAIWDASVSTDPGRMQKWAGAMQAGESSFTMAVESVSVQCYADTAAEAGHPPHGGGVAWPTASGQRSGEAAPPAVTHGSELGNFGLVSKAFDADAGTSGAANAVPPPDDDVSKWLATTWLCLAVAANPEDGDNQHQSDVAEYENKGTRYDIVIQRKDPPPESGPALGDPERQLASDLIADKVHGAHGDSTMPEEGTGAAAADAADDSSLGNNLGGFNLDGILDLMAGDDKGNVNFGAIGLELANNLANVIDMNEVGSMASTLGMVLSGLGAVNEIQRQGGIAGVDRQNPVAAANLILNSGITALIGQVLSNQGAEHDLGLLGNLQLELPAAVRHNGLRTGEGSGKAGGLRTNQEAINLHDIIAGNQMGGIDVQQLAGIMNGLLSSGGTHSADHISPREHGLHTPSGKEKQTARGGKARTDTGTLASMVRGSNTRSIASAVSDFVNGNDTAGFSDIAQAIGIRNFLRAEDKKVPDGLCLNDSVCDGVVPTGEGGRCYNGSKLVTTVVGQCTVGNKGLSRYLPDGVMPKMTFGCDRNSSSCSAQFWISGKEAFYCNLDQCNIGTWGAQSTASIDCRRMKCACIPGRFLCGNYGLDISTVLNEVEGPVDIKCHERGFSDCYIREFVVSKTLASIIGDDAINMECSVGQCMHYSQLPDYKRISRETRKSNMLIGIGTSLLTVYLVLRLIRMLMDILQGVSGIVYPGEIMAILGASGAGKSTLLDILARREKCGKVGGKVLINNCDLIGELTAEEFHRMSGYVDQQDIHVATATVYESVMTSALLRLPRTMSQTAKQRRVRQVLTELGLWSVRDSRIGKSGARGISGGEMRRVSIACELVTSPSIIFLDEPTSGLDAYSAYTVMLTLSQLARRYGRTIVCTIHQPRADIFGMFDRLIVLAAGQMCYSGPALDITEYFKSIGHPVPEGYNVADFSVDLVQHATVAGSNRHLSDNGSAQAASTGALSETQTRAHDEKQTGSKVSSDGEWSPLLGGSRLSLLAEGTGHSNASAATAAMSAHKLGHADGGANIFMGNVDLQQLLRSYADSPHHKQLSSKLDSFTGIDWEPTAFEMVTYPGLTRHSRPVTPMQQVRVIFLNLYDLTLILCRRLRGQQVSQQLDDKLRPTVYEQFLVLSGRIFRNLYRDPTLMLANYALSLFIGLMCGVLFYQLDNSVQGMQNRLGLLMFVLAFYGFGCTTSLLVFAEERLLYLRERANAYYSPLAYFMAKVTFDLVPLRVIPPLLLTLIAYPMIGLAASWPQFIKFFSTLVLFNLTVASQMFFIGLLAEELVVSNFLASIMLLFSLLFGGLILNKESIPAILQNLCRISSFNLAYEALAINELRHAHIEEVRFGLEIQVPTASLVSSFGFDLLAFWPDVAILCAVLAASLGLSLLWLTYVIRERR